MDIVGYIYLKVYYRWKIFPDRQRYTSINIATFVPIYIYKRGWLRDILIYPSIRSVGGSLWAEIELFLKINVTRAMCDQHVWDDVTFNDYISLTWFFDR